VKIGIVVHTNSGHTLAFARAIRDKILSRDGNCGAHGVEILGLRVIGSVSPVVTFTGNKFEIKSPPKLDEFDAVLAGGPVWMFNASPVIMKYLIEDAQKLKGKKALSFVTMGSPFKFMGGERAIRKMNGEFEAAGADVLEGEMLQFFIKVNAAKMAAAADRICERLGV
jgi:flavodoxin